MDDAQDRVTIAFLGPLHVQRLDRELAISRRQSRVLLALLAAARGQWVSADRLSEALWADKLPKSPRASLQVAIVRLRSAFGALGNDIIESGADGYRLAQQQCSVDFVHWQQLVDDARTRSNAGDLVGAQELFRRARETWRGAAFDGLDEVVSLSEEAEQLRRDRINAELEEAQLLARQHQWALSVSVLSKIASEEPLREDIAIERVLALHFSGRSGEALQQATLFRHRLSTELGLSPSGTFDNAERRVFAGEEPTPAAKPHLSVRPELVATILEKVEDSFERSKSLLQLECPSDFDIEALFERLRQVITSDEHHNHQTRVEVLSDTEASEDTFHRMIDISRNRHSDGSRLLVLVDPADESASSWLERLLSASPNEPTGAPLVVVSAQRDNELPPHRSATAVTERLHRLVPASALAAVTWHQPGLALDEAQRLAGQLVDEFGGAPLWIEAALRSPDQHSRNGAESTRPDSTELSAGADFTLARAAVLGHQVDCSLVAACLDTTAAAVLESLGAAIKGEQLVAHDDPGVWAFASQAIRGQLASAVPLDEAKHLHAIASRWLIDQGRVRDASGHVLDALPLIDISFAFDTLTAAAHWLHDNGDYRDAAERFASARDMTSNATEQAQCDLHRATALEMVGEFDEANRLLDAVIAFADNTNDAALIAQSALAGTGQAGMVGGVASRRRRLALARNRLDDRGDLADQVAVELALEKITSRRELEPELLAHVTSVAEDVACPSRPTALRVLLVFAQIRHGAPFEQAEALVQAMRATTKPLSIVDRSACLAAATHVALECGRWDLAEDWIGEMQLLGDQNGHPRSIWQSRAFATALLEAKGEHDRADAVAGEALALGQQLALEDAEATYGLHHLGRAYVGNDLASFRAVMQQSADRYDFPLLHALRGLAAIGEGDVTAAQGHLRDVAERAYDHTEVFRMATIAATALLASRAGETEMLAKIGPLLDERAGRFVFVGYGGPCLGPVDWYRSVAAPSPVDAERFAQAAKELCERERARSWLAGSLRRS